MGQSLARMAHETLRSRTFWINFLAAIYVALTGNLEDLRTFHLDDHTMAALTALLNVLNVMRQTARDRGQHGVWIDANGNVIDSRVYPTRRPARRPPPRRPLLPPLPSDPDD